MQKGSQGVQKGLQSVWQIMRVLLALGILAGVIGAGKRASVESRNKFVEIGLEYEEVSRLAQVSQQPIADVLQKFKAQGVTSIIVSEDLLASLEPTEQAHATRITPPHGLAYTYVRLDTIETLTRISESLAARNIPMTPIAQSAQAGGVIFDVPSSLTAPDVSGDSAAIQPRRRAPANSGIGVSPLPILSNQAFAVNYEYQNLRSLGLGLSRDTVRRIQDAHLQIVGRIGNFPGVTPDSAENVLKRLHAQGVKLVIFNGDEALGHLGIEKTVASMFRNSADVKPEDLKPQSIAPVGETKPGETAPEPLKPPTGLVYGAVEMGKQKGDETIISALHGDVIRVHAIQTTEMAQLERGEIVDRFVRAARERNIRFCYVRLLPLAGGSAPDDSTLQKDLNFVQDIARGIAHGNTLLGGGYQLAPAFRYGETGGSLTLRVLCLLLGSGTGAGIVWMLRELCPLLPTRQRLLLYGLCGLCGLLAALGGETGRKFVALFAGIAFPTVACLRAFPRESEPPAPFINPWRVCLSRAAASLATASAITGIGILHVIGLLATRPFMLRANQFLGIKAQHAVPLLAVAFVALIGGMGSPGENWKGWKRRVDLRLRQIADEPARFGLLLIGLVALVVFLLIVARTGNDSGVGASGGEMKLRTLMDHMFPVRPRTKEFLLGHPAFVLAIAWWWRGRRKLAVPAFVVGSIGQASLLNTFCHIHTPLIISLWHGVLGLVLGVGLGAGLFLLGERLLPKVEVEEEE